MIALLSILFGAMGAGQAFAYIGDLKTAVAAGKSLLKIQDASYSIYPDSTCEHIEYKLEHIEFCNVNFAYPSRKNQLILNNFNIKLLPNKINAFVGFSGCGKSTLFNLIMR